MTTYRIHPTLGLLHCEGWNQHGPCDEYGCLDWANADLRGANLTDAALRGSDLRHAALDGANLSGAVMYGADLSGADMDGADMAGAALYSARLYGANLIGANLSRAAMGQARLSGARLSGACLSGAGLVGTVFHGADLSGTCLDPEVRPNGDVAGFERRPDGWIRAYRTRRQRFMGGAPYEVGKEYCAPWFSVDKTECHPGLYISPTVQDCAGYDLIEVSVDPADIHHAGDNWRCRRFFVERALNEAPTVQQ